MQPVPPQAIDVGESTDLLPQPPLPRLQNGVRIIYSIPTAGLGFMENLIGLYLLKFATDTLLIAPAIVATLFALGRLWDGVSDPLAGYLSDRTRHRDGRRRPWVRWGAVPLGAGFVALWAPPDLAASQQTWWLAAAILLFYTGQSAVSIPHLAWGAELEGRETDRTHLFGIRLAVTLIGTFIAAACLGALENSADPRRTAFVLSATAGIVMLASCIFSTGWIRAAEREGSALSRGSLHAFRGVLSNPDARLLLVAFFLEGLGFWAMLAAIPYYLDYVVGQRGQTAWIVSGGLIAVFVSIPVWVYAARRYGKRRVWKASLFGRAVIFGSALLTPHELSATLSLQIILIGAMYGAGGTLGPSVKADVIDADERRTGERKEGTYFATWNLASKAAAGAAVALVGYSLNLVGFEANAEQTPLARSGIVAAFAAGPCIAYLMATLALSRLRD